MPFGYQCVHPRTVMDLSIIKVFEKINIQVISSHDLNEYA